jgi:hypothetical protein
VAVSRVGEARSIVISTDGEIDCCGFGVVAVDLLVRLLVLCYRT